MPKRPIGARRPGLAIAIGALMAALSPAALSQVTPAAGYVPPDDKPSLKVGFTLFADYTYTDSPTAKNADGSEYNPNAFNVSRAYLNFTGQLHHLLSYRITTDLVRVTDATGTLSGSYAVRVKYAFAQLNMDDWLPKGSWVRLGLQQTPYIDYAEGIYRYRFQSPDHGRPRRLPDVVRPRSLRTRQLPEQLRRRPRRLLQRRGLQQGRGERPEGLPDPRRRSGRCPGSPSRRAGGSRATGTPTTLRRTRSATAGSSTRRSSTRTSTSASRTSRRRTRLRPAPPRSSRRTGRSGSPRARRSASRA